jgi:hypothetical protein
VHMFKSAFMSRGKFEMMKQQVTLASAQGVGSSFTTSFYILITLPDEGGLDTNSNFFVWFSDGGSAIPAAHASSYSTYTAIEVDVTGNTAQSAAGRNARMPLIHAALAANSTFTDRVHQVSYVEDTSSGIYEIRIIPLAVNMVSNNPTVIDWTTGGFASNVFTSTSHSGERHKIGYGQNGTVTFNPTSGSTPYIQNTAMVITGSGYQWNNGFSFGDPNDSTWRTATGQTLGGQITDESYIMHSVLPIVTNLNTVRNYYPFSIFRWLANLPRNDTSEHSKGFGLRASTTGYWEYLYKYFNTVALDRYDIEDNVGKQAVAGMSTPYIRGIFRKEFSSSNTDADDLNKALYGINNLATGKWNEKIQRLDGTRDRTNSIPIYELSDDSEFGLRILERGEDLGYNTELREADGALTVFKPKLYVSPTVYATQSTQIGLGNHTQYKYTFVSGKYRGQTTNVSEYTWLNFIDLTGCYLASSRGKKYKTDGSSAIKDTTSRLYPSDLILDETTPNTLSYVLSHELDTTHTENRHTIIVDKPLSSLEIYMVLQPNHIFSYDFSPQSIRINELSSKYTKVANENSMYKDIVNYSTMGSSREAQGEREGVMSMYVVVDVDKQTNSSEIVIRNPNSLSDNNGSIIDLPPNMVISDGETTKKLRVKTSDLGDDIGYFLDMSESNNLKGVVSLTESITLTVGKEFDSDSKRCIIGSGVKICNEAEDLINNLLEDESLQFSLDTIEYPLFVAPNFQGSSLMDSIQFLTEKKDKTIIYENETFSIKDKEANDFYSNILINDTGDYEILDYEKVKTTFDLHNEIIVYGNSHKATKKDLRSIQKRGRKTLEVFERELITQDEVDKRAKELLKLHSTLNTKLILTVSSKGLGQLRAGDIIQVEIERENIERSQYMVLQIEHRMTGLLKLELGRYSKQLEDRFAELLISNKKTNSAIRNQKFSEPSTSFDFLDDLGIKPLRLHIRTRTSSGGATLGFGTTLNTSTAELGFEGGAAITLTTLVDEELV